MDYQALSNEHTFLVSDHPGDMPAGGQAGLGLYYKDTRHVSKLELKLNGLSLNLLSSSDEDVYRTVSLLTNPHLRVGEQSVAPGDVSLLRSRVVLDSVYEQLTLTNYSRHSLQLELSLHVEADFADLFEVRGFPRGRSGELMEPQTDTEGLLLRYKGGDEVTRSTRIGYSPFPDSIDTQAPSSTDTASTATSPSSNFAAIGARLLWRLNLAPAEARTIELCYTASTGEPPEHQVKGHAPALERVSASYARWQADATSVQTDNEDFNRLLERSALDLRALTHAYPTGRLPVAGIPWYAVPFGRDSIITALQTLSFQPDLAVGTLRFLAAHQGKHDDPWRDEDPGRIMHELRFGELAGTRQVPHTPYYGSVDSTPLFVMLFAQTLRWTGDRQLYEELMPAVLRALEWIDTHGDLDNDRYIEFRSRSERGIANQGWKDSGDSLLYHDGAHVEPPIALVEAQAYVHAAKVWLAEVARAMGDSQLAATLESQASALRRRFNDDFWLEDSEYYTQALDSEKRPVPDITSNPGHALIGGIVPPQRAARVVARLLAPDMAGGWGVRTRASSDSNYNPMSYHNGSVWPHDNSLIAWGMAQSGHRDEANEIASQLLAAARHFRLFRLPELYCGWGRGEIPLDRPADYPVSCSPQAWAAGTPYLLLQSILGLEADALHGRLRVRPHLPTWIQTVVVHNLRVGQGRVSLRISPMSLDVLSAEGVEVDAS